MLNTLTKKILEVHDIKGIQPDLSKIGMIPETIARQLQAVIFDSDGAKVAVLTTNNFSEQLKQLYTNLSKKWFEYDVYYTSKEWIEIAYTWYQLKQQKDTQIYTEKEAQKNAEGLNAVAMINKVVAKQATMDPGDFIMEMVRLAFQAGSSDLHFQPEANGVHMRLRIDGVLQTVHTFSHKEFTIYIQKLKFIAGTKMNIDYVPQDGRFSFDVHINDVKKTIDVRASFMPGIGLESTVLRFLDSSQSIRTFEDIGFWGQMYDNLKEALDKNFWMVLVTWPTGSWKTATLYSILNYLNDGKQKIITLEDPIEFKVKGLQQSQINYSKNYNYEKGLKACLRHDPDIILVGETRTLETAETALSASLTGHLVFTTLHTNSAIEAITRIANMWIKGYTLAPALIMIQAQRLVRKVCKKCGTMREANDMESAEIKKRIEKIKEVKPDLAIEFNNRIPHAQGCPECNNTWYKGRVAVIEVLKIDEKIKEIIINGGSESEIMTQARINWFLTLQEDGYLKMLQGTTTLEELRRTI